MGAATGASRGVRLVVGGSGRPVLRPARVGSLVVLAIGAAGVGGLLGLGFDQSAAQGMTDVAAAGLFCLLMATGFVVVHRVPANAVGWLLCGTGLFCTLAAVGELYARRGWLSPGARLPAGPFAGVLGSLAFGLAVSTFLCAIALFPDGRPCNRAAGRLLAAAAAGYVASGLAGLFAVGPVDGMLTGVAVATNPLAPVGTGHWPSVMSSIGLLVTAPLLVGLAVVSLLLRLRAAGVAERAQLVWVLLAVVYAVIAVPLDPMVGAGGVLFASGVLGLPVAVGVAMVRFRLYAVNVVVNRALRYGGFTLLAATVYVVAVSLVDAATRSRAPLSVSAAAAGVVALMLAPVYLRLRQIINTLTFGTTEDPGTVRRSVGRLLEAAVSGPSPLEDVSIALMTGFGLSYVAIESRVGDSDCPEAAVGCLGTMPVCRIPLVYQGRTVGRLVVADGTAGAGADVLEPALGELAPQLAAVVAAVGLSRELDEVRGRLTLAYARQRQRILSDLHDRLGPALAAMGIQAELARVRLQHSTDEADRALVELARQSRRSVGELRRMMHGLVPAGLERDGLVAALTGQANSLSTSGLEEAGTIVVRVHCPAVLPRLPEPVQMAAYLIATEAMTNAVRHARAAQVDTALVVRDGDLVVEVSDDGTGVCASAPVGLGMASMRRRAERVGGSCAVSAGPRGVGTCVRARLPVEAR